MNEPCHDFFPDAGFTAYQHRHIGVRARCRRAVAHDQKCEVLGLVSATGQWQTPGSVSGRTWLFLVLSGLATGASWLCYFRALKLGDAARVAPIDKLSVVLVALFGVVFLGERLSGTNWLGVALIALGALLVALRP